MGGRSLSGPPESGPSSARGVLVVTDDPATRAVFERALVGATEPPSFTTNIEDALECAQHESPDVVFVEVGLGNGAAVALIHHLRAAAGRARIVAMVRPDAVELGAQALSLGASGIVISPPAGDEILSAVTEARARRVDSVMRERLLADTDAARLASEVARELLTLGAEPSRRAAADALCRIVVQRLGATAIAVYVPAAERARELIRLSEHGAASAPAVGDELMVLAHAAEHGLEATRLELGRESLGLIFHSGLEWHARHKAELLGLVSGHAAAAFALIGAREQAQRGAIKDPGSSAYTFAYFVDVAGREIDKARRHGRRFSVVTATLADPEGPEAHSVELAERALSTVRATDVLARVDDHEFYLLLSETGGIGAHHCRRRLLAALGRALPGKPRRLHLDATFGSATYPHDGADLSGLLRKAKHRADAAHSSIVHRRRRDVESLDDLLDSLLWDIAARDVAVPMDELRAIELPLVDLVGLAHALVGEALRGGSALLVVSAPSGPGLGAIVRAAAVERPGAEVRVVAPPASAAGVEALAVVAEHGSYAFLGRRERSLFRAVHSSNTALVDVVLDWAEGAMV